MSERPREPGRARRPSLAWAGAVLAGIVAISVAHYTTTHEHGAVPHHIYRRLYYLPILVAAWSFGLRGGLAAAATTVLIYVPHAFGLVAHADPSSMVDKVAEILLFAGIGGLTGWFVDRERQVAGRLRALLDERDSALAGLVAAQERLVEAESQAALGHLTCGLAHEIRNPLGAIRGSAEILRDEAGGDEGHRRIARRLVSETERLDGVLSRFLRFAGREEPQREPTDLSAVAQEVTDLVSAEARQRRIELGFVRSAPTPLLPLDAAQVRQMLLNLVVNALQAQPDGGTVRVVTGTETGAGGAELFARVEDAGPGVPEAERGRIFHPYYSGRPGGTGLGLSLARKVAVDHGGSLAVTTSALGGACFEFRMPAGGGGEV